MNLFRVRRYGAAEWTLISINTPGDDEDENGMVGILSGIIGSALDTSSLHVQIMSDEGVWENV